MPDKANGETADEGGRAERRRNEAMVFYRLKLESCYLQSGAIRGNYKEVKDAGQRIEKILVELEKLKVEKQN